MGHRKRELIAKIISYLFLPPVLNLISFFLTVNKFEPDSGNSLLILGYTSLFSVVLPVLVFILFLRKGKIADADARNRTERHIPYLVFAAIILAGYFLIPWHDHAVEIKILFLIYLANLLTLFFVNLLWKISAHTMGAGGLVAVVILTHGFWGLAALPVVFALGWARFELKCHTTGQILAGASLGVFNTLILFKLIPLI